MGQIILKIPKR